MLVLFLRCLRCSHYWQIKLNPDKLPLEKIPDSVLVDGYRLVLPAKCPECRSKSWDKPLKIV